MATGVHIGGVGAGLEAVPLPSAPSRTLVGAQGATPGAAEGAQPSFAEHLASLREAGPQAAKPDVRPAEGSDANAKALTQANASRETPTGAAARKKPAETQAIPAAPRTLLPQAAPVGRTAREWTRPNGLTEAKAVSTPRAVGAAKPEIPKADADKQRPANDIATFDPQAKWSTAGQESSAETAASKNAAGDAKAGPGEDRIALKATVETQLAAVPISVPVSVPVAAAKKLSDSEIETDRAGEVKSAAARSREAKLAAGAFRIPATATGDSRVKSAASGATASTQAIAIQAHPTQGHSLQSAVVAGSTGPTSLPAAGDATAAATIAVRTMPESASAIGATVESAGSNETGLRTTASMSPGLHDEMEGAAGAYPAGGGAGISAPRFGGGGPGDARTLVATSNVLEVGITGGAHGWLRVRAELEHTGEVTASLVASSAAAADALMKELGAMSAYLKSESMGVSSLAVTGAEKGAATHGYGSGGSTGGTGTQGHAGGRSGRETGEEDARRSAWAAFREISPGFGAGYGGHTVPAALLGAGVGGWLNVRV